QGFIVLPGGFGTFDELFEAITLIQTGKIARFPIVMIGKSYWNDMIQWLNDKVLAENNISSDDMDIFHVVENAEEAVNIIVDFYKKYEHKPNF
ncbi:MAG: LOG family protein, partial [Bacteroidota bacterium]